MKSILDSRALATSAQARKDQTKKSTFRVLSAAFIVAVGFCFLAAVLVVGLNNKSAGERDFISYWAAGQQLVHGANPYEVEAVRNLERASGREDRETLLVMRNPPAAFFVALPLGLFNPKTALTLCLLASLAGLSLSLYIVWLMNGRPNSRIHLLGYCFPPVLACFLAGQTGIFVLLGSCSFSTFTNPGHLLPGPRCCFAR